MAVRKRRRNSAEPAGGWIIPPPILRAGSEVERGIVITVRRVAPQRLVKRTQHQILRGGPWRSKKVVRSNSNTRDFRLIN